MAPYRFAHTDFNTSSITARNVCLSEDDFSLNPGPVRDTGHIGGSQAEENKYGEELLTFYHLSITATPRISSVWAKVKVEHHMRKNLHCNRHAFKQVRFLRKA